MSKSRDIADSAATINYIDTVTSNVQTQLNAKGVGSVTSVGGTGSVSGLTLTGTVTGSGNLTLGGTLADINLASGVTGTLPVANGGTGATSLTANNVVLGNGTSAVQGVAPGTSGNILTSNGSTWASTAPAGGGALVEYITQVDLTSDSASIIIDNAAFNSTSDYDYLILKGFNIQTSDQSYMQLKYRVGGTSQTTSNYSSELYYQFNGSYTRSRNALTRIDFVGDTLYTYQRGNSQETWINFEMELFHKSGDRKFNARANWNRGSSPITHIQSGHYRTSPAINMGGIEFYMNSGNFKDGSVIKLYGVKEQ